MAELFEALWRALKPGPNWYLWLVAICPTIILTGAVFLYRWLNREVDPPQEEKLLRPPGYTLSLKMDEALESMLFALLGASAVLVTAAGSAVTVGQVLGFQAPVSYTLFFGTLLIITATGAGALIIRAWRKAIYLSNVRLGLRGEQAVAEALNELADAGYRSFHDMQPEKTWNIDHVTVGSRGVFLIETKARRRRNPRWEQPKHVAVYDEKVIQLPFGRDTKSIPQVERNCRWLADFLSKKTGEEVRVEGIVAMPGWYIEAANKNRNYATKVMNCQYLTK